MSKELKALMKKTIKKVEKELKKPKVELSEEEAIDKFKGKEVE